MNDLWITTYTGKQFFITEAAVDDICIEDIAHGLSNVCRYAGQCKTFYSVAEHSVRMAELEFAPFIKLLILLHDASEAYLGDVTSLLKQQLPKYIEIETHLLRQIHLKYGIDHNSFSKYEISVVKTLDAQIRTPEVNSLLVKHDGWRLDPTLQNYGVIRPWTPKKAEKRYLNMFESVLKERESVKGNVPIRKSHTRVGEFVTT